MGVREIAVSTICIIQARMGSERLPGKILRPLLDQPMLAWIIRRVAKSRLIDEIVLATTTDQRDDVVDDLSRERGWALFRGSENDVLDRYYQAARQANADHVIRVTGDCPLIDPTVLDHVIAAYYSAAPRVDYASNALVRSYPHGLDVEVFSFAALERAWHEDQSNAWREHVTPYLYRHPELFRLLDVVNPTNYAHYRVTVDTPQDFELIRHVYEHFGHGDFAWQDVISLLEAHPEWLHINRDVQQKTLE